MQNDKQKEKYFDESLFEMFSEYTINYEHINKNIPIKISPQPVGIGSNNFWRLIEFFETQEKIVEVSSSNYHDKPICVRCVSGGYEIFCEEVVTRTILNTLFELCRQKKPTECAWYFYDANSCMEMPQFAYSFFLMSKNEIIHPNVVLHYSWMGDILDPKVLEKSCGTGLWSNEKENLSARIQLSYERFFEETYEGRFVSTRKKLRIQNSQETTLRSINSKLTFLLIGVAAVVLKLLHVF
jgi:hypothetical protein